MVGIYDIIGNVADFIGIWSMSSPNYAYLPSLYYFERGQSVSGTRSETDCLIVLMLYLSSLCVVCYLFSRGTGLWVEPPEQGTCVSARRRTRRRRHPDLQEYRCKAELR